MTGGRKSKYFMNTMKLQFQDSFIEFHWNAATLIPFHMSYVCFALRDCMAHKVSSASRTWSPDKCPGPKCPSRCWQISLRDEV